MGTGDGVGEGGWGIEEEEEVGGMGKEEGGGRIEDPGTQKGAGGGGDLDPRSSGRAGAASRILEARLQVGREGR